MLSASSPFGYDLTVMPLPKKQGFRHPHVLKVIFRFFLLWNVAILGWSPGHILPENGERGRKWPFWKNGWPVFSKTWPVR